MTWNVQRGEVCKPLVCIKFSVDLFFPTQIDNFLILQKGKIIHTQKTPDKPQDT